MLSVEAVIKILGLEPHPVEGGYFRETYRSQVLIPQGNGSRSLNTAIYYLLSGSAVSEMHRLPGDEIYHFYYGDPLETLLLDPDGSGQLITVGNNLDQGQLPQLVIPGGVWQGSVRKAGEHGFTLIGATMALGFDYQDYETGSRLQLQQAWPAFSAAITRRTPRG